jgi:hypothetical protein
LIPLLKHHPRPALPVLVFLFGLGNAYETEIRFCDVAAGVAHIGRGFLLKQHLGNVSATAPAPTLEIAAPAPVAAPNVEANVASATCIHSRRTSPPPTP